MQYSIWGIGKKCQYRYMSSPSAKWFPIQQVSRRVVTDVIRFYSLKLVYVHYTMYLSRSFSPSYSVIINVFRSRMKFFGNYFFVCLFLILCSACFPTFRKNMSIPFLYLSYFSHFFTHTVQKSRNMNKAKQVSNFLICGTYNVVEHYGKRIKILQGCPFEG